MKIAVVDDDKAICEAIAQLIKNQESEAEVCQFSSGKEMLETGENFAISFLDIAMEEMSGLELAGKLRHEQERKGWVKSILIFITGYREYMEEAFDVNAFHYLVKPIEEEYFDKKMERLFASMQNANEANLLVQKGYESNIISFDDIIFCEIIDRKIYLHLKLGEVVDYYDRIENLETKLDGRFFKCHRSYLINLSYLKSYKNGMAYMINDQTIPVSRLRSKEFSSVVLKYMKERRV